MPLLLTNRSTDFVTDPGLPMQQKRLDLLLDLLPVNVSFSSVLIFLETRDEKKIIATSLSLHYFAACSLGK